MQTRPSGAPKGYAAVAWDAVPQIKRTREPERHAPYGAPDLPFRKPASMRALLEGRKVVRIRKRDYRATGQTVTGEQVGAAFRTLRDRMNDEAAAAQFLAKTEQARPIVWRVTEE